MNFKNILIGLLQAILLVFLLGDLVGLIALVLLLSGTSMFVPLLIAQFIGILVILLALYGLDSLRD